MSKISSNLQQKNKIPMFFFKLKNYKIVVGKKITGRGVLID